MLLHFINNFTAVMLYFILGEDELLSSSPAGDFQFASTVLTFFIFFAFFAAIIILIRYYSRKKQTALS
jgi:hypothetical protein